MSATMARQRGRVQLEQSDMGLALNVAKMPNGGFSRATFKETHQSIKKPRAEVQEEKKRGVEFPGDKNVQAAIERHPAMIRENQMKGCLPCHNGTAMNPQLRWRPKGTDAHPPRPVPPRPKMPPAPPGDSGGNQSTEIEVLPPGYIYIHTPLPNAQCFNHDAYAKDCKPGKDFIPDLLTDQGPSTS